MILSRTIFASLNWFFNVSCIWFSNLFSINISTKDLLIFLSQFSALNLKFMALFVYNFSESSYLFFFTFLMSQKNNNYLIIGTTKLIAFDKVTKLYNMDNKKRDTEKLQIDGTRFIQNNFVICIFNVIILCNYYCKTYLMQCFCGANKVCCACESPLL